MMGREINVETGIAPEIHIVAEDASDAGSEISGHHFTSEQKEITVPAISGFHFPSLEVNSSDGH